MNLRRDRDASVRVYDSPPSEAIVIAPERDLRSGRPTVGDRRSKHRSSHAATEPVASAASARLPRRVPRWIPAVVSAAIVAGGVAGIAVSVGGGDDDSGADAPKTGAAAGAAGVPVPSASATSAATTAPPATTSAPAVPPTTVEPTTTAEPTTSTTQPPTTTTTVAAGLDADRITGYEITQTMTRAYDADGPTPSLLRTEPDRFGTVCQNGQCVYPWIEEIHFDATQRRIKGLQQSEFGCGIVRTESLSLRRTRNGTYRGYWRSTTEPMRTALCDTIAYEWSITMKPITE